MLDGADRDFDTWYQYVGLLSMVYYFVLSLKYYRLYKKLIVQVVSYADNLLFNWVRNFLLAFLLMQLLRVGSALFAKYIPALNTYMHDWWFYLGFAVIFYYIAITGYSNTIETKIPFKLNLLSYKPTLLLQNTDDVFAKNNFIEDAEVIEIDAERPFKNEDTVLINEWKPKILQLLQQEKIYEDAELSLTQVAKKLKTNAGIISKVINTGFGQNFNDFVNHYRIEAVKEKLLFGEQKTQTLLGIAYDCGFNSKATFNRAFKKATGQSPKEWLEKKL